MGRGLLAVTLATLSSCGNNDNPDLGRVHIGLSSVSVEFEAPEIGPHDVCISANLDGIVHGFIGPDSPNQQPLVTNGLFPADSNGAVGLNHYVQYVNTRIAIFRKDGTILRGPIPLTRLWRGFGG